MAQTHRHLAGRMKRRWAVEGWVRRELQRCWVGEGEKRQFRNRSLAGQDLRRERSSGCDNAGIRSSWRCGTNIYDQEQCHKERDTQTQHWVIYFKRGKKPLKEREANRPHGSSSQSRAALHPMMLLRYKHHIRQVVR